MSRARATSTATPETTTPSTIKLRTPAVSTTSIRVGQYSKLEAAASMPTIEGVKAVEIPIDISKPAPILRPSMVKHAGVEAGMRREVAKSVREIQELGPRDSGSNRGIRESQTSRARGKTRTGTSAVERASKHSQKTQQSYHGDS